MRRHFDPPPFTVVIDWGTQTAETLPAISARRCDFVPNRVEVDRLRCSLFALLLLLESTIS
jgi:hypothetical protein